MAVTGGPADGARVAWAGRGSRWIDPAREMGFAAPALGRALYRGVVSPACYVFAGFEYDHCSGCGVYIDEPNPKRCPLCGHERGGSNGSRER